MLERGARGRAMLRVVEGATPLSAAARACLRAWAVDDGLVYVDPT